MKSVQQKALIMLVVVAGSVIGAVRGAEAKQKWVFKMLSKNNERQNRAIRKADVRKGKVLLDDIEMAAFHKS